MRILLRLALSYRKTQGLLAFSLVTMVAMTFATQLEILSLGVITNKGQDFFTLFSPMEGGELSSSPSVSYEQMVERWRQIDVRGEGVITPEEANHFVATHKKGDLVARVTGWVRGILPVGESLPSLALFLLLIALFRAASPTTREERWPT